MAVIDSVKELVAAPSVCPEAKEAGEKYLAAVGTDEQKKAAGEKWCDCPACAAGKAVLDHKEEL